jgi:general secretion pathway protein D
LKSLLWTAAVGLAVCGAASVAAMAQEKKQEDKSATSRPAKSDSSKADIDEAKRRAMESIRRRSQQAGSQPADEAKPAAPPPAEPPKRIAGPTTRPAAEKPPRPTRRTRLPRTPAPPNGQPPKDAAPSAAPPAATQVVEGEVTTLTFSVAPVDPESRSYRFDYHNSPWADVLADFARMSGLSWLNEPDPPITENLTFRSRRSMTYQEALDQLNDLLVSRPLNKYLIKRDENYLVIRRLPDWMREVPAEDIYPTFDEMIVAGRSPYDIVMVNWDVPPGWTPYQIIDKFRSLFSDTYGTVVIGDKIQLTGLVKEHHRWRDVIASLIRLSPIPPDDDPRPLHLIQLKVAKAAELQTMLRQLYPVSPPGGKRGPGIDTQAEQARAIDIITDVKNNWLFIKAEPSKITEISEFVSRIDTGEGPVTPVMEVVKLQYADANALVGTLKPMFMKETQAFSRPDIWISSDEKEMLSRDIFPDPANNAVILVGGPEGVASAVDLVKQWDTPGENQINQVITLEHGNADEIAGILAQMFPAAARPGQPADRITPRSTSSLLVSCSKRTYDQIMAVIEKLDIPPDDAESEHLVQPDALTPGALANVLQQAFGAGQAARPRPRAQKGRQGRPTPAPAAPGGTGPRFVPDDATGYLIIYCTDDEWPDIESLIQTLDAKAAVLESRLRAFPLQNANAGDVVAMLQQMFPQMPGAPGTPGVTIHQFFADSFNNTVNVFAAEDFTDKLAPFIEQLDIVATVPLRVIQLQHADAEVVAPILQSAFGDAGGSPARAVAQQRQAVQGGAPAPPVAVGGDDFRVVAEPITNSLLINAPAKEWIEIEKLVAQMEAEAEKYADQRVIYTARNRPAEELAATLQSMQGAGGAPLPGGKQGADAMTTPSGVRNTLTIVPSGRQIILDGPSDRVAKAIQLLATIDVEYERWQYRKYAVDDAEEVEMKLRQMLAAEPPAPSDTGGAQINQRGRRGQPAAQAGAGLSEDAIQIYADTYENTILIGARREEDFLRTEDLLAAIYVDPLAVQGGPKGDETNLDFFMIDLKYKDAFDLAFDVEDILNPDNDAGGIRLDEGPTKKKLLVRNCRPAQRTRVEEVVAIFDVPDGIYRPGIRTIDTEEVPPEMLVRMLRQQTDIPFDAVPLSDSLGQVEVIDIHAGEPDDEADPDPEADEEESDDAASPCVLPACLMAPFQAMATGASDPPDEETDALEPAVCPVCRQSPCVLPAQLLLSLDAIALADAQPDAATDDVDPGDIELQRAPQDAIEPPRVTILYDNLTGKMIIKGPEDLLDEIETWLSDNDEDQPVVFRVFPLKFADVTITGQLLEQIFNQGQAVAQRGRPGRQPQVVPIPQPQPQQDQAGKPGQQPKQPQVQQVVAAGPTRIKVIPDARTKSLFVAAPLSDIPLIIDVLKKLDARIPPGEQNIRYFRLENLDADEVVETLQEVLGLDQGPRFPRGQGRGRGQQPGQPNQQQQEQMIQLQAQQGGAGAVVSAENISLSAEEQTNTIIARAPLDTLTLIEGLIKELDQEVPNIMKPEMRRIPLVNAQATSVATIVKDVVSGITGRGDRSAGRGTISGRVSVNADPRTNSVILGGQMKDIETVVGIVKEMDVAETNGAKIRQFTVKGDAAGMANTLKSMFASAQNSDTIITGDPGTGAILVKAPPPQMEEIAEQIMLMDSKVADTRELRTIKLLVGDAEQLALKLQEIFQGTRGAKGMKQEIAIKGAKANNTLYVTGADDETFESIHSVASGLDTQPTGIQVRRFRLQFASAVEINDQLTDMMVKAKATGGLEGVKLDLVGTVPDPRTNSLIVTGGPITFLLINDVLKAIDVEPPPGIARLTRFYQLPLSVDVNQVMANVMALFQGLQSGKTGAESPSVTANSGSNILIVVATGDQHDQIKANIIDPIMVIAGGGFQDYQVELQRADAEQAMTTIEDFLTQWKTSRGNKPNDNFAITADPTRNMLLLNCAAETKKVVDTLLAKIDAEGVPEWRFYALKHVNATETAQQLNDAFRQTTVANAKGQYPISITPGAEANTIMVKAPSHLFGEVESMLASLDQAGESVRKEHTITVQNTSAPEVARALQQIYDAGVQGRQGQTPPTIREVPGTTRLIVLANDQEFKQISELVAKIDVDTDGRIVHTVTMPELVPAETVSTTINELFGADRGFEGIQANYHEPTNTLLVSATQAEFDRVKKQVIDPLSNKEVTGVPKIYRIPLKYAVADEIARTLQDFFDKKSGAKRQSSLPPWMRNSEQAMEDEVSIVAEPSSNVLLVFCTETTRQLIEEIIVDIDVDPSTNQTMEMVALKYVDAAEMLEILTEFLRVSSRTKDTAEQDWRPWWASQEETKDESVVLAGDMRLKAIESMNAIVIVGKPEGVAEAVAKIKELDVENPDGSLVPQSIALANANAADLADKLVKLFNDPVLVKNKGASYVPPIIVAEDTTNSIIFRGGAQDFNIFKNMVADLDAQMEGEVSGRARILPVPTVRNLDELASTIQKTLNDAENNRKQLVKDYKPDLVSISADANAGVLIVACSKGKFDEVQGLVTELISMEPPGGRVRSVIKLKSLSPEEAKKLIEEFQTSGGKGGRSDASWTKHRRYEKARRGARYRAIAPAASLPAMMINLTLGVAVAQTSSSQPDSERRGPVVGTIRPRTTTQPAELDADKLLQAGVASGRIDPTRMTDSAKAAFGRKLSGAPITVAEAGAEGIVVEASEEDLEVIVGILEMLDEALPEKRIEYVQLEDASAKDLAKTLADVFATVQQRGKREVRPEDKVDIIPDPKTNGLYIAATEQKMQRALALIRKNEEAAADVLKQVKTYTFQNRRVSEVGEVLKKMVTAYLTQKGLDANLIGVEIDPQTNSVFITAGKTDVEFVTKIIEGLDAELPPSDDDKSPMGEADVMIIPLRVAQADALGTLLNELVQRAATGDTPMKDFIRRFRLLDENGEPLASVSLDRPLAIFGDPDSNALVIASTRKNCLIMKQVAMAFDREPARAEVEVRVFSMKNADATEVADQLNGLLTESEQLTKRPGKGDASGQPDGDAGNLVYKAVVTADARTNQLTIIGRPDAMAVLTDLVTRLDVKGLDVMPFTLIRLEHASVSSLETALSELMTERAEALPKGTGPNAGKSETVIIKGDPRSGSLIIAAKANRLEELKNIIAQLDVPSTALIEDIRTITLKNTTASDLATKLKDLWEQRQAQQDGGSGAFKLETPAIVADERSNSLIVAAGKGDFEAIKSVVEKIEALELNPMANIYLVRLKFNSASQLQPAFTALFDKRAEMRTVDGKARPDDQVAIEVDETTNTLLFVGSRENYDVLVQKIAELDQEIGVAGVVEFFVCNNVGAARVKETIDQLFEDGVFKPGASGESELAEQRNKVTVSIDERANMLLVSASPENMAIIREIYKRMNSVTTPWDVAITKLIEIEHADAVRIGAQVADYFEKLDEIRDTGGEGGGGKSGFGITVFADERSNRLVVGGTKDGIDSAVELIRKLDVPPGRPNQVAEVYTLKEAPASQIGEMIKGIFEERNQPRTGADGAGAQIPNITVSVEPSNPTNSLLINAAREDHILIQELIDRLDRPSTLLDMVRVIPLERAPAARVKEILDELYQSGEGGEGREGRTIGVVEDTRTNAVVVTAAPGELENIVALVRRLDETEVKGQVEVGVYLCENEDAEKMADLLREIMTGQGEGGGTAQQGEDARELSSLLISFASKGRDGRERFLQTIRENVQITFNTRTNSIVAVAPPATLRLIEQLVQRLDEIQKRSVLVKVFMLRHADATRMVELLEAMFAQDEGSEEEAEFQRDREVEVEGGTSATGGVPTAASQGGPERTGTFGRPKTTFTADERTNSIISAGWPEDIDVVADVIDQLDSQSIQARDNVVYTLVNQDAETIQTALDAYFQAEIQTLDTLGETMSPQQRMEREVSVIAHPESNQLILSTSPRYKNDVLSIIEQLDMAPPQVMIQVFIAEVTLIDNFEMGVEFALQELRFSETAVAGGNGVLQSSHFDVVGGTDLGASGSGLGGFSFTITGEDFNFLVRALQSDSRLEVIQRPMIMCQDNQPASIQIGQSVPTPSGSQAFAGQTSTQVTYTDVGVILNVEPHINPDGFVYMLVEPEISSVTDSNVQIAPGAFAPIFNTRNASTNVAVKDGETVVIGGLITTEDREAASKVPLLGDIPGLGALFRTTTQTKNRTELLIALTPTIVRTVEDARRMSEKQRDGSGIITDEIKQSPLFGKLQVTPESAMEVQSIDAPPTSDAPPDAPTTVPVEPARDTEPKYGPQPPQYGPLAPGEEYVAQRTVKTSSSVRSIAESGQ